MRVTASTDWTQSTDLLFKVEDGTKGKSYEASASYHPDDGTPGYESGWSVQKLGDKDGDGDGETTFVMSGADVAPASSHRPGVLTIWLREPKTSQDDTPVMSDGLPMVATQHVP